MLSHVRGSFQYFFQPERINSIAKETGMIERQRKLTGDGLLSTLAFWRSRPAEGRDLGYLRIGRTIRYRRADVEALLERSHVEGGA